MDEGGDQEGKQPVLIKRENQWFISPDHKALFLGVMLEGGRFTGHNWLVDTGKMFYGIQSFIIVYNPRVGG